MCDGYRDRSTPGNLVETRELCWRIGQTNGRQIDTAADLNGEAIRYRIRNCSQVHHHSHHWNSKNII